MGALVNMQKGGGDGCRRAFSRGLTSLIRRKPVDSVHTRSETRGLARRLSLVDLIAIGIIQTFFFHILDLELCIRRKIRGKMPPGPQRFKSSQGLHYEVLDFHDTHSL
ncbi:hypothetical protein CK203_036746 [Vitis vinifera]|uniref:Uncharacterized protein n=1 Tax=Vitis vinifera TaxID=29760 RepID=A0A438I0U6_VITVI|nr:hypothetical protein CK203_036746 [Vitis vinifera]